MDIAAGVGQRVSVLDGLLDVDRGIYYCWRWWFGLLVDKSTFMDMMWLQRCRFELAGGVGSICWIDQLALVILNEAPQWRRR